MPPRARGWGTTDMLPRESRREVVIPAQMRSKSGWSDVTIRNISPHGMMLLAPFPPKPGSVVEVRKASLALVGRVIWVKGKTLGIQLIERLNFNALLRAANEGWAASQVHAPSATHATAQTASPPDADSSGAMIGWLLAGVTIVFAGACAAITLWQV
ncbi:PilZ domain-containing protein [Sphingomonas sp. KR3-1]|uniref:PilZ domain-containing protein n=1 Tax=Sphingomonas sp. KR3-1 TaxID=3156611 RepID=UPI0032B527D5